MFKRKTLIGVIFAGIAAISLAVGYSTKTSQAKTASAPAQTAYSHVAGNKGTVHGKVGTDKVGLEYIVSNLPCPKASVAAKPSEDSYARLDYDNSKNKTGFYCEKKMGDKASIKGSASFGNGTETANLRVNSSFDTWLENAEFSYTERLGRKKTRCIDADLVFELFGRRVNVSAGYDLLNGGFQLKKFKYA